MLLWTGKGYLLAIAVFALSLAANLATNAVTGGPAYWDGHEWPLAAALFAAALFAWFFGRLLHGKGSRVLVDKETGEEVVLNPSNTLFFIPVEWWAPILTAIAVTLLAKEFVF